MSIRTFFKRLLGQPAKSYSAYDKAALLEPRYDADSDPLVSNTFATTDLADFLQLYSTHPWVFVCASAIANAAASVKWQVLSKGKEVDTSKHPEWLLRPNPHMTWYDFIESILLYLELSGNCYLEVVGGTVGDGKIEGIFPLRPDRMKIKPDPVKKVAGYDYNVNAKVIPYKPEDILHLKYTDPRDEYYGVAPVFSARSDITLDFWATAWNKKFFRDGAEPGGVLETDQSLTDQAWNRLRNLWAKRHKGVDNAHNVAVLEEGLKYKVIGSSHSDMQFAELKKMSRDTVLAVMRVPPVMVGISEGVSYASSRDQKKVFWQDNVIPKLMRIEMAINAFLIPEGLEFKFVTRSIDSMIEDDQVKSSIANSLVSHGILTINEIREKYYGLDKLPWGDVYWAPVGLAPVHHEEVPAKLAGALPPGNQTTSGDAAGLKSPFQTPSRRGPEQVAANLGKGEAQELEKIEATEPDWEDPVAVRDWREWTFWKTSAAPDDRVLRNLMLEFWKAQYKRALPRIERHYKPLPKKVKKAEGDEPPDLNEPDVESALFDIREENGLLHSFLVPSAEKIIRKYGNLLLVQMGLKPSFKLRDEAVEKFLEKFAADYVKYINDTTRSLLRKALVEAAQNGEDFKDVVGRIRDIFEGEISAFRAKRIARTELVTLTNSARFEAAKQSGVVKKKRWISELLPTTRREPHGANHEHMHGKIVDFDQPFEAPNRAGSFDKMDSPGDLSASPENVVGCLCIASYFSGTEEFADLFLQTAKRDEETDEKDDMAKKTQQGNVTVNVYAQKSETPVQPPVHANSDRF